jgi:hypothetical protein
MSLTVGSRRPAAASSSSVRADPSKAVSNEIAAVLKKTPLALNGLFGNEADGPLKQAYLPKTAGSSSEAFKKALAASRYGFVDQDGKKVDWSKVDVSTVGFKKTFADLRGENDKPEERQALARLQHLMETKLTDLKVFYVDPTNNSSSCNGRIFIVGKAKDGDWVGLSGETVWT